MKWLVFFLLFPHFKPAILQYMYVRLDLLFDIGRFLSALLILFLYVLKKRVPSKPVWILLLLQIWILIATYIKNSDDLYEAVLGVASIVTVVLIIDMFSKALSSLLRGIVLNFEIAVYMNLFSVVFFPKGMALQNTGNPCYFLAGRNGFILFCLPAIVVSLLCMQKSKRKLRYITLIIASCAQIIIKWSATSIVSLIAFGLVLACIETKCYRWITYKRIFVCTMAINLLISVFRIMDRITWIVQIIESGLRRDASLTGRTMLWDSAYKKILASPWIGYGRGALANENLGLSSHNQWMQFLLEGGLLALVLFLLFNFVIGKQLEKYKDYQLAGIFFAAFTALYMCFISDVYCGASWFYIIYILAYHIDELEKIEIKKCIFNLHLKRHML